MPELPEVETIRRGLDRGMTGARLRRVEIRLPKIIRHPSGYIGRRLVKSRVAHVHRRAKLILIHWDSGWTTIIHLKMTGQLIWQPRRGRRRVGGHDIPGGTINLPNKFSHVIFYTDRGTLFFNDQRQFGYIQLKKTAELNDWLKAQGYGPEPLADEFTLPGFIALMNKYSRRRLKPTLLDQKVIAGVGNIYADEVCFAAAVKPARKISTLTVKERQNLYGHLRRILTLSISKQGTTADTYRMADGKPGGMKPFLKVYGRGGELCRRCRGTIKKVVLGGRGTHYCPSCQR